MMNSNVRLAVLLSASLLFATLAWAAPTDDAAAAVGAILDKFNGGEAKAFADAHMADAVLVDEFAPYVWQGTGSAGRWLNDYGKYAEMSGISGARSRTASRCRPPVTARALTSFCRRP